MIAGTVAAQLLVLATSPVLTRLYSPADFGLLGVFAALVAPLALLATIKYDAALLVERDDAAAANLLALVLGIGICICLLVGVLLWLAGGQLTYALGMPQLQSHLWLLPLALFGAAAYNSFTVWAMRERQFSAIAETRVSRSLLRVGTQCGWGLLLGGPVGLLLGEALGQFTAGWRFARLVRPWSPRFFRELSLSRVGHAARSHLRFPLLTLPASLLTVVCYALPCLLFPKFFGAAYCGYFLLSQRLTDAPLMLLGPAIGQAYAGDLAARTDDGAGNFRRYRALVARLCILGGAMAVGALSAPLWLATVFGPDWKTAGDVTFILAPALGMRMIAAPLMQVYNVFGRQALHFGVEILRLGLSAGALVGGPLAGLGFRHTLMVWSAAIVVVTSVHWLLIHVILQQHAGKPQRAAPSNCRSAVDLPADSNKSTSTRHAA